MRWTSWTYFWYTSVQFSRSVVSDCDRMDCSTPGFPVHHQLLELAQTHVHWVGDAIQLSHPLLSPSPPTFNLSQHLGLFQWVSSLHQVAKVLELLFQHQSENIRPVEVHLIGFLSNSFPQSLVWSAPALPVSLSITATNWPTSSLWTLKWEGWNPRTLNIRIWFLEFLLWQNN